MSENGSDEGESGQGQPKRPKFPFLKKGEGTSRFRFPQRALRQANQAREEVAREELPPPPLTMPRFHAPAEEPQENRPPTDAKTTGRDSGVAQSSAEEASPPLSPLRPLPRAPSPALRPPSQPPSSRDHWTTHSFEQMEREVNAADLSLSSTFGGLRPPSKSPGARRARLVDPDVSPASTFGLGCSPRFPSSRMSSPSLPGDGQPFPSQPTPPPFFARPAPPALPSIPEGSAAVFQRAETGEAVRTALLDALADQLRQRVAAFDDRLEDLERKERGLSDGLAELEEERLRLRQADEELRRRRRDTETESAELRRAKEEVERRRATADKLTEEQRRTELLREKLRDREELLSQREAELARVRGVQRETEKRLRKAEDDVARHKVDFQRARERAESLQGTVAQQRLQINKLQSSASPSVIQVSELPSSEPPFCGRPGSASTSKSVRFADEGVGGGRGAGRCVGEEGWERTEDEGVQTGASLAGLSPLGPPESGSGSGSGSGAALLGQRRVEGGAVESAWADGTRMTEAADAASAQWDFPNGDTRLVRRLPDGGKEEEYRYAATGAVVLTKADGTKEHHFANGQREVLHTDGRKEIFGSTGERREVHPDGTRVSWPGREGGPVRVAFPDGSWEERFGERTERQWPSGEAKVLWRDGRRLGRLANGHLYLKDRHDRTLYKGPAKDAPPNLLPRTTLTPSRT